MPVHLMPIDDVNRDEIGALRIAPHQHGLIDTVSLEDFIADAPDHPTFACYGIYDDTTPVGFVSAGYEPVQPDRGWIPLLIIDERYQQRGYGRAALEQIIGRLREEIPHCEAIGLAYKPGNAVAAGLYASLGFKAEIEVNSTGETVAWLRA